MANATLTAIRNKVRRLTRSPSPNQLSNDAIDEYVNTFIAYDFPEELRLFSLKKDVSFTLEPNVGTYTVDEVLGDVNTFITFNPPAYVAGFKALWSQSEDEFYNLYPFNNSISDTSNTGDGATLTFTGTLSSVPLTPGQVAFTSISATNDGLTLRDSSADGILDGDGTGAIDYVTGVYSLTFSTAPADGKSIVSQTAPYVAARPDAILYFNNSFTVRPIPDQPYVVQIESYVRPTQLMVAGDEPNLEQWWQYIAYGAAKKVFEDRMDITSVQTIMPELKRQETLVLRRTIVQNTNQRTATIYAEQAGLPGGWTNSYNGF